MSRFAPITLAPVALLALGLALGGLAAWAALCYITVFTFFMDRIVAIAAPDDPGVEFPSGRGLSVVLGLVHLPLLWGGIVVLASGSHPLPSALALFVALSLFFGQVSNSNAHELIHAPSRARRRLGVLIYVSLLFGHHVSAHTRVHHVHAASARDPNSARLGEGFWAFAARAWIGSFREGWRAESRLRAGRGGLHPYLVYGAGSVAALALSAALAGGAGVAVHLALAAYAQLQLLLSDYVQHYGLRRAEAAPGRLEPVGPEHSWNAPHGFSAGLMLNAPRHSDHHAAPSRAYPGLRLDRAAMPMLPHSLPVMAVLALVPPIWRRVMDRRARAWSAPAEPR
ncbi:alkane 1-monooxygenase [Litorisediminicola beolgyonensis]|uniref:Alkane 1-monooxygenase n=1 Tax=Litorisediminicola beolgyonensis TaxID=1173614 RepID=A0ABW3ZN38_9RHOB